MATTPTFVGEEPVPVALQGGAAFSRLYVAEGGGPACAVLYNATQMVLTDFVKGTAKEYRRDPQASPASDCDGLVREYYSSPGKAQRHPAHGRPPF
jgi:hypothetical protein